MKYENNTMLKIFQVHFETLYMYQKIVAPTFPGSYHIGRGILFSLACETGLKALIEKDNITIPHTHKLNILFNKLSSTTKDKLIELIQIDVNTFQKLILENSSHFEKWRYFAEGCAPIDCQFLEKLLGTIITILFPLEYLEYCYPVLKERLVP